MLQPKKNLKKKPKDEEPPAAAAHLISVAEEA
jgi:hypothetical protein